MPKKSIKKDSNINKFDFFYFRWKYNLNCYCLIKKLDLKKFSNDILREYFADGKTIYEAYKELLSDLPLF